MLSFMELLKMAIVEFVVGGICLSLLLFPFVSLMDDFIKAEAKDKIMEEQREKDILSRSIPPRQEKREDEMFQFHAEHAFWILLISSFALIGGIAAGYSFLLYLKKKLSERAKEQRTISGRGQRRKEYDYYYIMEKQTR